MTNPVNKKKNKKKQNNQTTIYNKKEANNKTNVEFLLLLLRFINLVIICIDSIEIQFCSSFKISAKEYFF